MSMNITEWFTGIYNKLQQNLASFYSNRICRAQLKINYKTTLKWHLSARETHNK